MNQQSVHLKITTYLIFYLSIFTCIDRVIAEDNQLEKNCSQITNNIQTNLLNQFSISQGKGTFTQNKHFKFLSEPIISKGLFILQNQTALWQTQSPVFSQLLLTPKAIYTRLERHMSYQLLTENGQFSKILSKLLSGKFDKSDWQEISSSNCNCVNLIPTTTVLEKIFAKVQVCFVDNLTRQFKLVDSNNNVTEILMNLTSLVIDETDSTQLDPENIQIFTP